MYRVAEIGSLSAYCGTQQFSTWIVNIQQILADTMAVPFQPVSTFGKNGVDWHNKLIFGDNLQALKTLIKMKEDGELVNSDGTPGVRLIYIDPPFATKEEFRGTQDQKAYQDKIAGAEFLEFLRKRLVLLKELLSDDGSIYLHLDWRKGHYAKILMDEIFGENHFVNDIIWHKGFRGTESKNKYQQAHELVFLYSKKENYVWNQVHSPYRDENMSRYNKTDKKGRYALIKRVRTDGTVYYGKTYFNPKGKKADDVINVPVMAATSGERINYCSQSVLRGEDVGESFGRFDSLSLKAHSISHRRNLRFAVQQFRFSEFVIVSQVCRCDSSPP